jgi:hypothetical protein
MMNETDKFFKQKLGAFERNVPASAWGKVEQNIARKRTQGWWLKIAASVALFIALFVLAMKVTNEDSQSIAEKTIEKSADVRESKEKNVSPVETAKIPAENKNEAPKNTTAKLQKKNKAKTRNSEEQNRSSEIDQMKNLQPSQTLASSGEKENTVPAEHDPVPALQEETIVVADATNDNDVEDERSAVTLVYSADEVNAKYLNKNTLAGATPDTKKSSTLRKLLDKAYDLKHNQDPVGELRQKKNEILALNFKNEKQRSQNR